VATFLKVTSTIFYAFVCPIRAKLPANCSLIDFTTLSFAGGLYESERSSLCYKAAHLASSTLLSPNIFLSYFISNTYNLYFIFFLKIKKPRLTTIQNCKMACNLGFIKSFLAHLISHRFRKCPTSVIPKQGGAPKW
jgi:hypothetical protein